MGESIPQLRADINALQIKLAEAHAKLAAVEAERDEALTRPYKVDPALIKTVRDLQQKLRGK